MRETDARLIVLAESDTVAVARCAIEAGTRVMLSGRPVTLAQAFTLGHKVALSPMSPGDKVLKYGVPIGSATKSISPGDHVHLHNMKSDYTPTYALTEEGHLS